MRTNCFDVSIIVKCVPGDDKDAICQELQDILVDLDILPYDYELKAKKVGEFL